MSLAETIRIVEAWLPYPVYEFRGGPFDGKGLKVELIEREDGWLAPDLWRVAVYPPTDIRSAGPHPCSVEITYHLYRFIPSRACPMNQGHYEWVPQ